MVATPERRNERATPEVNHKKYINKRKKVFYKDTRGLLFPFFYKNLIIANYKNIKKSIGLRLHMKREDLS